MAEEKFERAEPIGKRADSCKKLYIYEIIILTAIVALMTFALILLIIQSAADFVNTFACVLIDTVGISIIIWSAIRLKYFSRSPQICVKINETQLFFYANGWHCVNLCDIQSIKALPAIYSYPFLLQRLRESGKLKITTSNGQTYKVFDVENVAEVKVRIEIRAYGKP